MKLGLAAACVLTAAVVVGFAARVLAGPKDIKLHRALDVPGYGMVLAVCDEANGVMVYMGRSQSGDLALAAVPGGCR